MTKGLPPIIKQTVSNEAQKKSDRIKRKLNTDTRNCNDWRFQLHWNKIEIFNPIIKILRKTYSISSGIYILKKMIEHLIGFGIHY